MSERAIVLDASALLALLFGEPGADRVKAALPRAVLSAVNLSEVVATLSDRGVLGQEMRHALGNLDLDVRAFDAEAALATAQLRLATRALGLSLGDRACLALAMSLKATAVTADQAWSRLELDGLEISMIR